MKKNIYLLLSGVLIPHSSVGQEFVYRLNSATLQQWENELLWVAPTQDPNNQYPKNGAFVRMGSGSFVFDETVFLGELLCQDFQFLSRFDLRNNTLTIREQFNFQNATVLNGTMTADETVFAGTFTLDNANYTTSQTTSSFGNGFTNLALISGSTYESNGPFDITSPASIRRPLGEENNRFINNDVFTKNGFGESFVGPNYTQNAGLTEVTDGILEFAGSVTVNAGSLKSSGGMEFTQLVNFNESPILETVGDGYFEFRDSILIGIGANARLQSTGEAGGEGHVRIGGSFFLDEFALSAEAPLLMFGGSQGTSANVNNTGYFIWDGGTLGPFSNSATEKGQFIIGPNEFDVNDFGANPIVDELFVNNGYVLHGDEIVRFIRDSVFMNNANATYEMTRERLQSFNEDRPGLFVNEGTFLKGREDDRNDDANIEIPFESTGTVEVTSAELNLRRRVELSNRVIVRDDARLIIESEDRGAKIQDLEFEGINGGLVDVRDSEVELEGTLSTSGDSGLFHFRESSVTITTSETATAEINGTSEVPVQIGDSSSNPTISPQSLLTNVGVLNIGRARLSGNTFANTGTIDISRDLELRSTTDDGPEFRNSGMVIQRGRIRCEDQAAIIVEEGGTHLLLNGENIEGSNDDHSFTVQSGGTFRVESDDNNESYNVTLNEVTLDGRVELASGRLNISPRATLNINGGEFVIASETIMNLEGVISQNGPSLIDVAGTLETSDPLPLPEGGRLTGNGTLTGTLNQAGNLEPGETVGNITINGNLSQSDPARTIIELTPTTRDTVTINGSAALNGELVLNPSDLGNIPLGTDFPVLTAASISGTFDTITSLAGPVFEVSYTTTQVLVRRVENENSYGSWAEINFGADANNPEIAGPFQDPDNDGVANAFEFIQGTSPTSSSVFNFDFEIMPDGTLQAQVPIAGTPEGYTLDLIDLRNLAIDTDDLVIPTTQDLTGGILSLLSNDSVPMDSSEGRGFFRIRITIQ